MMKELYFAVNVGIIAVAVAVVTVLIVIFNLFGVRSYKTTVKKYFEASIKGDVKTVFKLKPEGSIVKVEEEEGWDKKEL